MVNVREVVLDGKNWVSADDFYDSFFQTIGAPAWHGRNFNALRDSILGWRINTIEVPYILRIKNFSCVGPEARSVVEDFVRLIIELRNSGCGVDVKTEG